MTVRLAVAFFFRFGVFLPPIEKLCTALPVFLTAKTTSPTVADFLETLIAVSVIVTLMFVVALGAAVAAARTSSDTATTVNPARTRATRRIRTLSLIVGR